MASLGSNVSQTLQGLAATSATGSNTAQLYSTLAFVQLVGIMIGREAAAVAFSAGMRLRTDSSWAGLPYMISAVSCLISRYSMAHPADCFAKEHLLSLRRPVSGVPP